MKKKKNKLLIVENQKIRERMKGRKKKEMEKREEKEGKKKSWWPVWPMAMWGCGRDSLTHEALRS